MLHISLCLTLRHLYRNLKPFKFQLRLHFFSLSVWPILNHCSLHIVAGRQGVIPLLEWGMWENKHCLARRPLALNSALAPRNGTPCFEVWQVFMIRGSLYTPIHAFMSDLSLWCTVTYEGHTITKTLSVVSGCYSNHCTDRGRISHFFLSFFLTNTHKSTHSGSLSGSLTENIWNRASVGQSIVSGYLCQSTSWCEVGSFSETEQIQYFLRTPAVSLQVVKKKNGFPSEIVQEKLQLNSETGPVFQFVTRVEGEKLCS